MKRLFDVTCAFAAIVLFAPLFVCLALLVRLNLGSPVLFRQIRPGKDAQPFQLIKFRTMNDLRGTDGELLPDKQRQTSLGRFLRSSSLDELPEVYNVLKGDMSFVGPRPLLMEYLPYYSAVQARRHEVRPGITGYAQVMGRNAIIWEEKFEHDVWYVDNHSLWLDITILFTTILKVVRRDDINASSELTMPKFKGSEDTV